MESNVMESIFMEINFIESNFNGAIESTSMVERSRGVESSPWNQKNGGLVQSLGMLVSGFAIAPGRS